MRLWVVLLAFVTMVAAGCAATPDSGSPAAPKSASTASAAEPSAVVTPSKSPSAKTNGPRSTAEGSPSPQPRITPSPQATLPRGGRTILPEYRLVGFAGGRSPAFGRLSVDALEAAGDQIDAIAGGYGGDGRTILPVFELITVVAHGSPAADGLYRTHEPDEIVQQYLDAARAHGALLLLNVQPGRSNFLDEVKRLEKWLREPDVGVALDPEWAVDPGEVPGRVYGRTTGRELDSVAGYLSSIVQAHDLPEKVMVFHQVHASVVENEAALRPRPGVVAIKSVDGIGARASKEATWRILMRTKPAHVHAGFKLFFDEDTELGPLMTPAQVLALKPTPDYVLYE